MRDYHARILLGHFARLLHTQPKSSAAPLAVLGWLWSAHDPHALSPLCAVGVRHVAELWPHNDRKAPYRWIAALAEVGAVRREEFGLRLLRPEPDALDAIAREQLAEKWAYPDRTTMGVGPVSAAAPVEGDGGSSASPAVDRRTQRAIEAQRRADYLDRLGKKPIDVRDLLVHLTPALARNKNRLRYEGKGSGAVTAAVTWMVDNNKGWDQFFDACKRVAKDRSPDKPKAGHEVFFAEHGDYLARVLGESSAQSAAGEA